MKSQLEKMREKFLEPKKPVEITDDVIIDRWHYLMRGYNSWIPFKEYTELPIIVVNALIEKLEKEREEMKKRAKNNKINTDKRLR